MSYWVAFVVSFKFVVFDFSELAVQNRQPLPPDRPLHPLFRQRLRRPLHRSPAPDVEEVNLFKPAANESSSHLGKFDYSFLKHT